MYILHWNMSVPFLSWVEDNDIVPKTHWIASSVSFRNNKVIFCCFIACIFNLFAFSIEPLVDFEKADHFQGEKHEIGLFFDVVSILTILNIYLLIKGWIHVLIRFSYNRLKMHIQLDKRAELREKTSIPRRLTRTDFFRLLWIFCFRNHYSIPLSPWDGICRPG